MLKSVKYVDKTLKLDKYSKLQKTPEKLCLRMNQHVNCINCVMCMAVKVIIPQNGIALLLYTFGIVAKGK